MHVQDFQAFACTSCGRCCKPWLISIEPQQTLAIEASQAYQARTRPNYTPLQAVEGGLARLGDRGDNACVFLDPQSLCSLHSELGAPLKPLGCQVYPYQPVRTPDGIYAYLSFGCPPVVAGLDQDADANREDLTMALAAHTADPQDTTAAPFLVKLTAERSIGWQSYLSLETKILAAYSAAEPLDSILRLVLSLLRVGPEQQEWPDLSSREDLSFPKELYLKYLGSLLSTVEVIADRSAREQYAIAIETGGAVASQRFGMELPPLALDQSVDPWVLRTYDRYFRNAVLGKSLLKGTVVSKLLATASAMVLVGYYAEAYRQSRGADDADPLDCWTDAFRLVECDIITHTDSSQLFFRGLEETFIKLAAFPLEEAMI